MAYMMQLTTYLNKNAWDTYAGLLDESTTILTSDSKYGEDLI